ncbi:MAG: hypothetical protein H6812_08745 [Phycisphaeraceae bacterium]|nr:hypothetical protein [Phycisphaerales bacterium]MCB9843329.1 hypothetical protein [Phycisphaeraceae bacterium]
MNNNLIALIVAIPFVAGILTTATRGHIRTQRALGGLALFALLGVNVLLMLGLHGTGEHSLWTSIAGGWPAPFGIALVYDQLSGLLMGVASIVAIGCFIYACGTLDRRIERGWFHPLFHLLIMGVNFSFLTGDLFNLFVSFEIMLMASYAMLCLAGTRPQIAQAYKYILINLVGSTIFVLGAGLIYGVVGTLNIADLARIAASDNPPPPVFQAIGVLLLFVFALKAAVFPLWFWLPDTYHTLPTPIVAMFSALLSKVGVYAILRLFPSIFASPQLQHDSIVPVILSIGAGATMIIAILGALSTRQMRRALAMLLIAHVGYLIFGISVGINAGAPNAYSGVLFYMTQEMILMAALFLATGLIESITTTDDTTQFSGLATRAPGIAALCFVIAASFIGFPPLSGFYGKAMLVREGFATGNAPLAIATLFTAAMTLFVMIRLWAGAFWGTPKGPGVDLPEGAKWGVTPVPAQAVVGTTFLAGASIAYALAAGPMMDIASNATAQLNEPRTYVTAILGDEAWPMHREPAAPVLAQADPDSHSEGVH